MRIAPAIELTPDQQSVLEAQARSRSLPARVVERSRILLLAAEGKQDKEIARSLSISIDSPLNLHGACHDSG